MDKMGKLWRDARQFGSVNLFTHDNQYSCSIKFHTVIGVELEAKSGFGHKEPEDALKAALASCDKIVDGLSQQSEQLQSLRRLR